MVILMERGNKRQQFINKARLGTTEALKSRDMLLGYIAKSIEGMDEAIHLLTEKLEDSYSPYFPELKLDDKKKYAEVALCFDRKNPNKEALEQIVGAQKSLVLIEKAKTTLGAELQEEDLKIIRKFAAQVVELHKMRAEMDAHQEKMAKEICPNIMHIANASIAAKLIAHVGSLKKLAFLPASTIQVLGAEKALFKHLRSKGRIGPPKHGIIFQYPLIGTAPKEQRGKIARVLATKIAIASKADAFSHNFIADELKKSFEKRLGEIKTKKSE